MSLVLALEPDHRQAQVITRVVRELVHAELVLADSRDAALTALAGRTPDVVLLTALLSPRDEDELLGHIRRMPGAEHVQAHTIPQLATRSAAQDADEGGGLLGKFRKKKRRKDADPIAACDPDLFAAEIKSYLARAEEVRTQAARQAQNDADETRLATAVTGGIVIEAITQELPHDASSAWSSPFEWRRSEPPSRTDELQAGGRTSEADDDDARARADADRVLQMIQAEAQERAAAEAAAGDARRQEAEAAEQERRRLEAERQRTEAEAAAERERLRREAEAAAEQERRRLEAEAAAEQERLRREAEAAAEAERARIEAEAAAERERLRREAEAAAARERKRIEAEAAAERERLRKEAEAAAKRERARLEAEAAAERERLRKEAEAAAKRERERLEAEAAAERERLRKEAEAAAKRERERLEAEAAAERERLRAEAAAARERERLEAEAAAQRERERLQAEAASERERLAAAAERERQRQETGAAIARERARLEEEFAHLEAAMNAPPPAAAAEVEIDLDAQLDSPPGRDPFAAFREGHDEQLAGVLRLLPITDWARCDPEARPPASDDAGDDLAALMSRLMLAPDVACVRYADGCRIRRVRVPAIGAPLAAAAGPVILSRRALQELRGR